MGDGAKRVRVRMEVVMSKCVQTVQTTRQVRFQVINIFEPRRHADQAGRDGFSVVRELRTRKIGVPVLALTARNALEDRVQGLDSGCDDYLQKPFAFDELLARLRAILRRQSSDSRMPRLEFAGLSIDPATRAVQRDGRAIELTNKEYALLELLLRHPAQVFTRTAILESVWGYDFDAGSNVLEVYMNFLRKKIDGSGAKKLLHTVRGVGYVLREEVE